MSSLSNQSVIVEHLVQPEKAGFCANLSDKLDAGICAGLLRGVHSVLVWQAGNLVLERYYDGVDETWGKPLGVVGFGPHVLHDIRSVTKSIVGLLYGIALDRGLVPPPEAPLVAQFREYSDLANEPIRGRLLVSHALNMTLGTEWDEQRSYADPANSERMMEDAADRTRFALDRPIVAEPGTCWIYCGGAVALLGALIARGAGMTLPEFARMSLFEPLGITTFTWTAGRDGVASAASGLCLLPRDLLRIGAMVLAQGTWGERRIVSKEWLDASFAPAVPTGDGLSYGRLWFLGEAATPALSGSRRWIAGFGNGGQRLWLMPDADLAAVVLSGNYNSPEAWVSPNRIWREIVLANLTQLEP